jgi:hypothetical protein
MGNGKWDLGMDGDFFFYFFGVAMPKLLLLLRNPYPTSYFRRRGEIGKE